MQQFVRTSRKALETKSYVTTRGSCLCTHQHPLDKRTCANRCVHYKYKYQM